MLAEHGQVISVVKICEDFPLTFHAVLKHRKYTRRPECMYPKREAELEEIQSEFSSRTAL